MGESKPLWPLADTGSPAWHQLNPGLAEQKDFPGLDDRCDRSESTVWAPGGRKVWALAARICELLCQAEQGLQEAGGGEGLRREAGGPGHRGLL